MGRALWKYRDANALGKAGKKRKKSKIITPNFVFPALLFPSDGVFQYLGKLYGFELLERVKITPKMG